MLGRASFQRGGLLDGRLRLPGARARWLFKQRLAQSEMGAQAMFETLGRQRQARGDVPRGGQIVDASIVQAPIARVKTTGAA